MQIQRELSIGVERGHGPLACMARIFLLAVLLGGSVSCSPPLNDRGRIIVQSYRASPTLEDLAKLLPTLQVSATSLRTAWNLSLFDTDSGRPDLALAEVGRDVFLLNTEQKLADFAPLQGRSAVYSKLLAPVQAWLKQSFGPKLPFLPVSLQLWGLWSNPDLVPSSAPGSKTTLEQFEQNLAELKKRGKTPIALGSSFGWPALAWLAELDAALHGAEAAAELWEGKRGFSEEKTLQSLILLQKWRDEGYFDKAASSFNWPEALQKFAAGEAAYLLYASSAVLRSGQWEKFRFGALPRPSAAPNTRQEARFMSIEGFVMLKDSPLQEQAVVFAERFAELATQQENAATSNNRPYRVSPLLRESSEKEQKVPNLIEQQLALLEAPTKLMLLPDRVLDAQAAYNINQVMIQFFASGSTLDAKALGSMLDAALKAR